MHCVSSQARQCSDACEGSAAFLRHRQMRCGAPDLSCNGCIQRSQTGSRSACGSRRASLFTVAASSPDRRRCKRDSSGNLLNLPGLSFMQGGAFRQLAASDSGRAAFAKDGTVRRLAPVWVLVDMAKKLR
jgi:hypothetical protein